MIGHISGGVRLFLFFISLTASLSAVACRPTETLPPAQTSEVPTISPLMRLDTPVPETEETPGEATTAPDPEQPGTDLFRVIIDINHEVHPISPLIYGLSGGTEEEISLLRPTFTSWGGNPSTRYNWELGNAWNSAADWFYRNGNYGYTGDSASDDAAATAAEYGMAMRLAIPTLGWVAKNDDNNTCSFPLADGSCGTADNANCANPGEIADPTLANVRSDPAFIRDWLEHLYIDKGFDIQFIAMDNEPELWGYTHYDVHPDCTTYDEILDKFLTYAEVVNEVAPQAQITGPNTCCWFYYWNSAAGEEDMRAHDNVPFIPWFLDQLRLYEEDTEERALDVLDIHFYPEAVYNNEVDDDTAALRLRSTRLLWDINYVEETWIAEPIALIPTMKELIESYYPGTRLGLSEWNWGADGTMNGALAIADVLGTFGREDLYFAAYWRNPPLNSPSFFAFQLYTNYDSQGGRFGDTSVWSETADYDTLSSYAALDSEDGRLHLMLVNKQQDGPLQIQVELGEYQAQGGVALYHLTPSALDGITTGTVEVGTDSLFTLSLPPYSITHLVFTPG